MLRKVALASASFAIAVGLEIGDFKAPRVADVLVLFGTVGYVYAAMTWQPVLSRIAGIRERRPRMSLLLWISVGAATGAGLGLIGWLRIGTVSAPTYQTPDDVRAIRQVLEDVRTAVDTPSLKPGGPEPDVAPTEPTRMLLDEGVTVSERVAPVRDAVKAVQRSPLYQPTAIPSLLVARASYATVDQRWRSVLSSPWLAVRNSEPRFVVDVQVKDKRAVDALFEALSEAEMAVAPNGAGKRRAILRYQLSQYLLTGSMYEQGIRMIASPAVDEHGAPVDPMPGIAKETLSIQDWHFRLHQFVRTELGEVATARLMNLSDARPLPTGVPPVFEHAWRSLVVGMARIDEFLKENPEIQ